MSEQNAEKDFILDLEMKLKINEHLLDILFPLNINKRVRGIVASGEQFVLRLYVIKSFLPSLKKIISYIRRIFEHKNKKIKRIFYFFCVRFFVSWKKRLFASVFLWGDSMGFSKRKQRSFTRFPTGHSSLFRSSEDSLVLTTAFPILK